MVAASSLPELARLLCPTASAARRLLSCLSPPSCCPSTATSCLLHACQQEPYIRRGGSQSEHRHGSSVCCWSAPWALPLPSSSMITRTTLHSPAAHHWGHILPPDHLPGGHLSLDHLPHTSPFWGRLPHGHLPRGTNWTSLLGRQPPGLQRSFSHSSRRFMDDYDKHHRVNNAIHAPHLQVFMPDGSSSLLSRKAALKAAAEQGLDLVEFLRSGTGPPIAKLVDYAQLRQQRRADREAEVLRVKRSRSTAGDASLRPAEAGQAITSPGSSSGGPHHAQGNSQPAPLPASVTPAAPTAKESPSTQGQQHPPTLGADPLPAAGGPGVEGANAKGRRAAKPAAAAVKVKEVFLTPKIGAHDLRVKVQKIRGWLQKGLRVSLSHEVDATDSAEAAVRAVDSLVADMAELATAGKKTMKATMVSVTLHPKAQRGKEDAPGPKA
ncbi:hypothetical protein V8C86DRAFT_2769911 [Haematococcus lacustris]